MSGNTSYLLLQFLENAQNFDFKNPLEVRLKDVIGKNECFAVDNHSDGMMVNYAKKFLDESENVVLICLDLKSPLGSLLPILNYSMKKKHIELVCIGDTEPVKSFVRMKKGKVFENIDQLFEYLKEF